MGLFGLTITHSIILMLWILFYFYSTISIIEVNQLHKHGLVAKKMRALKCQTLGAFQLHMYVCIEHGEA